MLCCSPLNIRAASTYTFRIDTHNTILDDTAHGELFAHTSRTHPYIAYALVGCAPLRPLRFARCHRTTHTAPHARLRQKENISPSAYAHNIMCVNLRHNKWINNHQRRHVKPLIFWCAQQADTTPNNCPDIVCGILPAHVIERRVTISFRFCVVSDVIYIFHFNWVYCTFHRTHASIVVVSAWMCGYLCTT